MPKSKPIGFGTMLSQAKARQVASDKLGWCRKHHEPTCTPCQKAKPSEVELVAMAMFADDVGLDYRAAVELWSGELERRLRTAFRRNARTFLRVLRSET
jgi:hypothetical protein